MLKLPSGQPPFPFTGGSGGGGTKTLAPACVAFEQAISRYVDGETQGLDHERVVVHLHGCEACRGFAESLRRMADLHRVVAGAAAPAARNIPGPDSAADPSEPDLAPDLDQPSGPLGTDWARLDLVADMSVPDVVADMGWPEMGLPELGAGFAALTERLYEENISRLAGVCYELGKAYILAGTGRLGVRLVASRPKPVGRMHDRGHRLHRESSELAKRAGVKPPRFERSLFRARAPLVNQSLENGRRYLQACLRIDPTHAHARLYLGHYFRAMGRLDRAKSEFRKVACSGADKRTRLMALIKLGIAFAYERRYLKAIACFRKVWESQSGRRDPLLGMSSAANLAIFTAKIDRFDLSMKYFGELITAFPNRAEEMRRMLARQTGFKDVLRRKAGFRDQLKERYPMLFAS